MYYSKKLSILYIACPKTGSTSIEEFLMNIDPKGEKFRITLNNREITSKDMHYGLVGHAHAWELKNSLGEAEYNKLQVIGMVRHPIDKLVSSYFFNKTRNTFKLLKRKGQKKLFIRIVKSLISQIAAKVLPLNIWVLLFPMKTSHQYYLDKKGNRIVKYLGRTDYLSNDLSEILKDIGISYNIEIPHINKSNHKPREHYLQSPWIKKYLSKKYAKDIELYKTAENEMSALQEKKR